MEGSVSGRNALDGGLAVLDPRLEASSLSHPPFLPPTAAAAGDAGLGLRDRQPLPPHLRGERLVPDPVRVGAGALFGLILGGGMKRPADRWSKCRGRAAVVARSPWRLNRQRQRKRARYMGLRGHPLFFALLINHSFVHVSLRVTGSEDDSSDDGEEETGRCICVACHGDTQRQPKRQTDRHHCGRGSRLGLLAYRGRATNERTKQQDTGGGTPLPRPHFCELGREDGG